MCAERAWDRVPFIDSHTGGEPTRVVLSAGPDVGDGPLSARLERLRSEHDAFRSAVVNEPRGSDVMVGALLCPPAASSAAVGVIFFNNVGYLGMCGHGTIGLVTTLAHMGRIGPGTHVIETPVGDVRAELHDDGSVSVHNVPARRHAKDVTVTVEFEGRSVTVSGDVAWGGNWFFLSGDAAERLGLSVLPHDLERLTDASWRIRQALAVAGVTGDGAEIDHVELFVAAGDAGAGSNTSAASDAAAGSGTADARSFVLCPGKAYDRSPCGTGTSAKLACLAADGLLAPGEPWVQESVIGSRFTARYSLGPAGEVLPVITGRAHVMASGELLFDAADPFWAGIA